MSPGAKALLLSRGVNPYTLPNQSFQWSTRGYPSSSTYILDGTNLLQLTSDRSGNSATNCLVLNGVSGNYASAPDSAALSITGPIEIRSVFAPTTMTPAGNLGTVAKWMSTGNQRSYGVSFVTTSALVYLRSADGSATESATSSATLASVGFVANQICYTKTTHDTATGTVKFYYSSDGSSYTQLGTDRSVTAGANFDSTALLTVGILDGPSNSQLFTGNIYRAQIYNGIAGTLVFDANFATAAKLATSFTESSSNAATVNINASGDLGARICGERDLYQATTGKRFTTSVINGYLRALGDGIDDYCASPSFQLAQPCTIYGVMDMATWTNGDILFDGRVNDTAQLFQDTTTPNVSVYAGATGPTTTQFPVANKCVFAIGLSGANSYIGINRGGVITGNAGTATPNGITLMARAAGTLNGNCGFYELIGFNGLHSADLSLKVRSALMRTNGL